MNKKTLINRISTIIFILAIACTIFSVQATSVEKSFLYNHYTLKDVYAYKQGTREFQWDKIKQHLSLVDYYNSTTTHWAVLENNKNLNGRAPRVKNYRLDAYKKGADAYNTEQDQGIPLYHPEDLTIPERYGLDGALVRVIDNQDPYFVQIESLDFPGQWMVPINFIRYLTSNTQESMYFHKVIVIDRTNQNIVTLEKQGTNWLIRSMNPATTGMHRPPYQMETPVGTFVIQEKKRQMKYYRDGTTEIGGAAPYANRFSGGGYIHGVPVDLPKTKEVEFSPTLGTTPRSHKCVRNATSHAKFIYEWAPVYQTIVIVIE